VALLETARRRALKPIMLEDWAGPAEFSRYLLPVLDHIAADG